MSDKQQGAVPEGFASLFESTLPKKASFTLISGQTRPVKS